VKNSVQKLSVLGLAAVMAIAVVMIVQLRAQQQSQITGDFRNANTAEIRDPQGRTLLRGTFAAVDPDDDEEGEIERLAKLAAAQSGVTASGEAEVEYQKAEPDIQEVEFLVTGAQAGAVLTLFIDGKSVVSATADSKGRAEAEINVRASR
jgi:hypothetical protein